MLNVKHFRGYLGHNAKIVAGTLHCPPQVRLSINCAQTSIGQYYIHGDKLVGNEAVVAL